MVRIGTTLLFLALLVVAYCTAGYVVADSYRTTQMYGGPTTLAEKVITFDGVLAKDLERITDGGWVFVSFAALWPFFILISGFAWLSLGIKWMILVLGGGVAKALGFV